MCRSRKINIYVILQFAIILTLCGSATYAQGYEDAPAILREAVEQSVQKVLNAEDRGDSTAHTRATAEWHSIVLYTVADALHPREALAPSIRDIQALKNKNEAARTDKKTSASSNAPVTTTMVEKAGLPRILAIAVERGAVEQSMEGTNLTLTTTPYALLTLFAEDSQQNYVKYGYLGRIGVSGTFLIDEDADTTRQYPADNLEELNLRIRLLGDRSTRSGDFNAKWEQNVKPLISKRIEIKSELLEAVFGNKDEFTSEMESLKGDIQSHVRDYILQNSAKKEEVKKQELTDTILGHLKSRIYDPLVADELTLKEETKKLVKETVVPDIEETQNLLLEARAHTNDLIRELENSSLLTLGYSMQRFENRSDISELMLIYDRPIAGRSLYANAFVSLNHVPDDTLDEKTVRDFGGALSWERKLENVLTRNFSDRDISSITISLDARVAYLEVDEKVEFSSQLRFTIPIARGLVLPGSIGFSSRDVESNDQQFWAAFGMSLDVDKLIAIAQLSDR
ncbi:MAG: hypothetical protein JSW64_13520 [Candidatus Zixiibacteriota bacterium]|nr:MAG: hypothetical protein JSW64_13520 [candidate division Zixibacteria bacterium]